MALGDLMASRFLQSLVVVVSNHLEEDYVSSHDVYLSLQRMDSETASSSCGNGTTATTTSMAYFPQTVVLCEFQHEACLPAGPSDSGLVSKWRPKDRIKMGYVALVLCLNISVDPPDVIKISPCARMYSSGSTRDCILLGACEAHETLPQSTEFPADVFTSCLTTPIKMSLRCSDSTARFFFHLLILPILLLPFDTCKRTIMWFCRRSLLHESLDESLIDKIPSRQNDRKTLLGELNWIFTAVIDTIAWNVLPHELFQRLFRQELDAWDMAAEICLSQFPSLVEDPTAECSCFFINCVANDSEEIIAKREEREKFSLDHIAKCQHSSVSKPNTQIARWDTRLETGTKTILLQPFSPIVIAADENERIGLSFRVWNYDDATLLNNFDNHDFPDKGISKLSLVNELDDNLLLAASYDENIRIWKDYASKDEHKLVTAFSSIQGYKPSIRRLNAVVDWQQQSGYLVI
ncbi:regulatory-associated protein of TOR 1-like [Humulus lupulus]|uniref:regulatory-associated protein of TOR 1-like n=1 Tax=Humulus lupulus TaxID=3486 RepID=UPI002B407FE8|nr:regulatory-associated protein of TOR 1-like [Humulus lupulus]